MNFNIETLKEIALTGSTKRTIKITRKNNKKMNINDVEEINKIIERKVGNDEYSIRLFGVGTTPFTIKSWDGIFNLQDMEDYTNGKVRDNTKFTDEFFQAHISYIVKNKK